MMGQTQILKSSKLYSNSHKIYTREREEGYRLTPCNQVTGRSKREYNHGYASTATKVTTFLSTL